MRIGGIAWYLWIRKHFPFLRPRSEFKNGETVYGWDEYTVIDNRIDHCGQIKVQTYEGPLMVDPYGLDRDEEFSRLVRISGE
jgi:hypothetical protein